MKHKPSFSATQNAISLESFRLNLNLLLRDPDHVNVIAYRYLREKKRLKQAFTVEASLHQTQLERDWNAFAKIESGNQQPSEALTGAVSDRLQVLLLTEPSRLREEGGKGLSAEPDKFTAFLYRRWASEVDNFHLSDYYPLIPITSRCLMCGEVHAADIVWNQNEDRADHLSSEQKITQYQSFGSHFHETAMSV